MHESVAEGKIEIDISEARDGANKWVGYIGNHFMLLII
jgi:hypothetical protein